MTTKSTMSRFELEALSKLLFLYQKELNINGYKCGDIDITPEKLEEIKTTISKAARFIDMGDYETK